ncbi:MAG: hypothetical protein ACRD3E_20970 [Terriglobales bacterium]
MSFESNIGKIEQTLRRALTQDERRLLKLWDLTCQSARDSREEDLAPVAPVDENTYTGRFKVVATKGYYEVYFVCGKLMLRPVQIGDREGVLDFLSQDPILLDEMMIKQGLAAADIGRASPINVEIQLSEPMLRSMGFRQAY